MIYILTHRYSIELLICILFWPATWKCNFVISVSSPYKTMLFNTGVSKYMKAQFGNSLLTEMSLSLSKAKLVLLFRWSGSTMQLKQRGRPKVADVSRISRLRWVQNCLLFVLCCIYLVCFLSFEIGGGRVEYINCKNQLCVWMCWCHLDTPMWPRRHLCRSLKLMDLFWLSPLVWSNPLISFWQSFFSDPLCRAIGCKDWNGS